MKPKYSRIAACLLTLAAAGNAIAADAPRKHVMHARAVCDNTQGRSTSTIAKCSLPSPGHVVRLRVQAYYPESGGPPKQDINCTAFLRPSIFATNASNKTIHFLNTEPQEQQFAIWNPLDFDAFATEFPSDIIEFSCALPQGAHLHEVRLDYLEQIGN